MSFRIIDISPLISERLGVFPGDVSFRRRVSMDFPSGSHLTLSSIETTLHIGAHTDAPNHYDAAGGGIHEADLDRYVGRCLVLHATVNRGERVEKKHLSEVYRHATTWTTERILVRTESFPDPDHWNGDFCSISPSLITEWAKAGVKLVGIDTPSVDPETSKLLETHTTIAKYGLSILEGIVLTDVKEGFYDLVALPLKIENGDAAPVRAVLIDPPRL